ncbi:MAG: hypothetical protein SD837_10385 [Candidatus Electrothrix scaldis]|nr:MAG: hypothetical protein SD837_10385 [Candidatus Electrothrix sp. GW3-3]
MSDKENESITGLLDRAEDVLLGLIAEERLKDSRESDYVDIESLVSSARDEYSTGKLTPESPNDIMQSILS